MSPKNKDNKSKKIKRVPEADLFTFAKEREKAAKAAAAAEVEKKEADQRLIEQLQLRGVKVIESDKFGGFTRITLVQPEPVEYDGPGILKALKPKQRELAFHRQVNLNGLTADARKRVLEVLTKEELAAVTTNVLNLDGLAKAIQEGKIDKEILKGNSWIKEIAPSIRISHGSGS